MEVVLYMPHSPSAGTHAHASCCWETQVFSYTHRFIYPNTLFMDVTVSFINLYAPFQCKSWNNQRIASCAYCSWLKVLRKTVHKKKLSKQSISTVRSPFSRLLLFLSTTSGGMISIPFNAPSDSSSLSFTYPATRKISKQSTAVDESKPSRQNQKKRSPLFNKRSSSPSLRLGHRRRHSPSLHSRVSCFPWSFINLCFFGFNRLCVVFVFNFCVFSVVFSMTLVWVYWSFV